MISDWNNLSLARKGDKKAFSEIHKRYGKPLLRMTSLITGSIDSAKDIVQDTFIRLLDSNLKYQEGNFKSYITTIAYRLALKEKSRTKREGILNKYIIDNSFTPIEKQINEESQLKLFQAISSLPNNQREVLVLRFYSENSYEAISEITQLPLGTVKSRIFYAVKAVREKLKEMGVIE